MGENRREKSQRCCMVSIIIVVVVVIIIINNLFYFFVIILIRFTLAEWVKKQLRGEEPEIPAVKQLRIWASEGDPMHKQFKSIVRVANPDVLNSGYTLRKLVKTYNGKPFLSNVTHTMDRENNMLILCFDVHNFSFLARKMYFEQMEMFSKLILDVGFLVESKEEQYLPERLLGCIRLIKFNPEHFFPGVSDRF